MRRPDAGEPRAREFQVRVTAQERQLISAVAATLRRNPSDAMRYLVYEKAEELGLVARQAPPRIEPEQPDADS